MDVKELRIGNWVSWYDEPMRVDVNDLFDLGEGKPIPLTEEWLVKFGLAVDKWFIDESFKITKDEHYGWEIHTQNATHTKSIAFAYIKYVHELQNLYQLLSGGVEL